MSKQSKPYGLQEPGRALCVNAEPGTFNHECGNPASWIGRKRSGFESCFCHRHKAEGYDARGVVEWRTAPIVQ